MKRLSAALCILLLSTAATGPAMAEPATIVWEAGAETIYDTGFMHMLMRHPDGVSLFDMELIENDGPGAGISEKGVSSDVVWGRVHGRKVLAIDDPRARGASLFVFSHRQGKYPLAFTVNGHESRIDNWKMRTYERFRWVAFPAEWLKKGKNVIDFSCPEAASPEEGWEIWLARADEFEQGGGDPAHVGETSFKSFDGGKSWKKSPFGPPTGSEIVIDGFSLRGGKTDKSDGFDRAEYSIRISLDRHVREGWLASPVIDLWKENPDEFFVRMRTIRRFRIRLTADVPEETDIRYFLRRSTNPNPFSDDWEPYEPIGEGPSVEVELPGAAVNRRYVQFKAELSTANPLVSPVFRSARIEADFDETFPVPKHRNIYVVETDNPPIEYSSVEWEWESWDRPEYEELRRRENLDRVIAGAGTSFEAQVRLMDYATKRWRWTPPMPEYPAWDALSNVERVNKAGGGGMCIQFNNFLAGMCMAYGWQARLVNIDGHEVCEVWNDDYAKWIYIDASSVNHYQCDIATGEPLNMLDLHRVYLDYFYPDRPIDWLNDPFRQPKVIDAREDKPPIIRSSPTWHDPDAVRYTGFTKARVIRYVPRNNWYEKPYPRPLSHGNGSHWPWNGYVCWYDERTPPRLQYSWHTDRPRDLWPDLNTVHIHAAQGYGNDRLFLQFESYTPNFSRYEVNTDGNGWEAAEENYTWLLVPGVNNLRVRAVNKLGAKGRPSSVTVNRVLVPMKEWETAY